MKPIVIGSVLIALSAAATLAAAHDRVDYGTCAHEPQCRKLSEFDLDRIRGGFSIDTPAGRLDISIGITRAVSINGRLVALSQLVLPDAAQIAAQARAQAQAAVAAGLAGAKDASGAQDQFAAQASQAAAEANQVASSAGAPRAGPAPVAPGTGAWPQASPQPGNAAPAAVTTVPVSASGGQIASSAGAPRAAPAPVAPGTGAWPPASPQPGNAAPATVTTVPVSASGGQSLSAVIVQNGPGNFANLPGGLNIAVLPTVIQNSLNDQVIRSATLINITANSLSALRSMALGDLLNRATISSGR